MKRRQTQSRGQALILVTLSLLAMCGIMGLAVDLGWSFFVKKEAQGVADAAALAAVREASLRLGGNFSGFVCGAPTTNTAPYCTGPTGTPNPPALNCSSLAAGSASNLENGCAYAARNLFVSGSNGQTVTMQAGDRTMVPTALTSPCTPTSTSACGLNAKTVSYWVTVRASQSIPQLFSAVLGNKLGVASAVSTAGVVGLAVPGNLITLAKPGDCVTPVFSSTLDCGVDIHINSSFFASTNINATGPIIMASTCNHSSTGGCSTGGGNAYAGIISGFLASNTVNGAPNYVASGGGVTGSTWENSGVSAAPVSATGAGGDPTQGEPQPPLAVGSTVVPTCGIQDGKIGNLNSQTPTVVGPYNYYACTIKSGKCVPNSQAGVAVEQLSLYGNVTFQANGGCQSGNGGVVVYSGGNPQSSSAFPTYLFWGGLNINGSLGFGASPTTSFGPGQYVMVGAASSGGSAGSVFSINSQSGFDQPLVQSVSSSGSSTLSAADPGNMFIFTAPALSGYPGYPGLSTQAPTGSLLAQYLVPYVQPGSVNFNAPLLGSGGVNLTGVQQSSGSLPTNLDQYNAILFWQDRANSTVTYNSTGYVTSSTNPVTLPTGSNAMNIFGLLTVFGQTVNLNGAIYQPRGAYISDDQVIFASNTFQAKVQIVTGSVEMGGFLAINNIQLGLPTNVLITYITGLLQ